VTEFREGVKSFTSGDGFSDGLWWFFLKSNFIILVIELVTISFPHKYFVTIEITFKKQAISSFKKLYYQTKRLRSVWLEGKKVEEKKIAKINK
jgi:hypothetical protein